MKICKLCDETFTPDKFNPKQEFCNRRCNDRWRELYGNQQMATCQACGVEFKPKRPSRNKYCVDCKGQASRKNYGRMIAPVLVTVCFDCGKHIGQGKRCKSCQRTSELAMLYIDGLCKKLNQDLHYTCKECGKEFTPEYGNKRRNYCTDECLQRRVSRITKAARRARMRNVARESIDPIAVFERDKWKCHICGQRTPKRLRGTIEGNAPELDHIIPLAQGGSHTWDNVACSCRKCNGAKGSQIVGQQLLPVFAGI